MPSSTMAMDASASSTHVTSIPTGTISAHIGSPPNTTDDYYIAKYLLMAFGLNTDPALGVTIAPARPANYVYETRGPGILVSMSIAISVMVIITGLRLGVRVFRRGLMVGWDDVFIIPGVLLAITWPTLQMCGVIYGGAGKHMYDLTYEEYGHFKTYTNLSKVVFFVAVGLIKVSICLFNQRLTSLTSRAWNIFNILFLILLSAYIMLAIFWTLFQCNPPYAGWNPIRTAKEGRKFHCISDNIVGSSLSVIHVIMDFGLLSVPLIVLWNVRMGWGTRFRLYFVFSIGAMSFIGSVVRQIEQERLSTDILWNFVHLQNWTLVDLTFGVVAASLPILSAFIPKSWKSVRGTSDQTNTPYGQSVIAARKNTTAFGAPSHSHPDPSIISIDSSESTEKIVRTDVIELRFQSRSQFFRDQAGGEAAGSDTSGAKGHNGRPQHDGEFRGDKIFPPSDHQTWIGKAT